MTKYYCLTEEQMNAYRSWVISFKEYRMVNPYESWPIWVENNPTPLPEPIELPDGTTSEDVAYAFMDDEDKKRDYWGACDVKGCDDIVCSQGGAWRETGYWCVCPKHAQEARDKKPQPQMKQSAIDREASRDENGIVTKH